MEPNNNHRIILKCALTPKEKVLNIYFRQNMTRNITDIGSWGIIIYACWMTPSTMYYKLIAVTCIWTKWNKCCV